MGTNRLRELRAQDPASKDNVNQFTSALKKDHVPRNEEGIATARAGSLGTKILPWRGVYADEVVIDGVQLSATGGGGGSTGPTLLNGVVGGIAPTNRPGMCGWMRQAGADGIQLFASPDNPLKVKLDGTLYELTSNLTGGAPLPSNYQSMTYQIFNNRLQQVRSTQPFATGGVVAFDETSNSTEFDDDSYGNTLILKFTNLSLGVGYVIGTRVRLSGFLYDRPSLFLHGDQAFARGGGNRGSLHMIAGSQNVLNKSATSDDYSPSQVSPSEQDFSLVRCGNIFVDPTTSTWTITISKRIVGSFLDQLPALDDYAIGDMAFRQLDNRWYHRDAGAWQKTNNVQLGICAIDDGEVKGVIGMRSEDGLALLRARSIQTLHNSRRPICDYNENPAYLQGHLDPGSDNLIQFLEISRSNAPVAEASLLSVNSMFSQNFDRSHPRFTIDFSDTSQDYTGLSNKNNNFFCCYVSADSSDIFFDVVPPIVLLTLDSLVVLAHPSRNAVFFGSFATTLTGEIVTYAGESVADQRGNFSSNWVPWPYLGGDIYVDTEHDSYYADGRWQFREPDDVNYRLNSTPSVTGAYSKSDQSVRSRGDGVYYYRVNVGGRLSSDRQDATFVVPARTESSQSPPPVQPYQWHWVWAENNITTTIAKGLVNTLGDFRLCIQEASSESDQLENSTRARGD